jgi:hypothetical protein
MIVQRAGGRARPRSQPALPHPRRARAGRRLESHRKLARVHHPRTGRDARRRIWQMQTEAGRAVHDLTALLQQHSKASTLYVVYCVCGVWMDGWMNGCIIVQMHGKTAS